MLALRSNLVVSGTDEAAYGAARTTAADAVTFDLAAPEQHAEHERLRALTRKHAPRVFVAGRPVHVRVHDARSELLDDDLAAVITDAVTAVVLPGVEEPQDARDADVAIRKQEMRLGITPGTVRLIAEVDSAVGLHALSGVLGAIDRFSAVSLNADALRVDLRVTDRGLLAEGPAAPSGLLEHAAADVAIAAQAAGLPWVLNAVERREALATRAHDYGAAGVYIRAEAEARGMNALFTPDPAEVTAARAVLKEWPRLRRRGQMAGAVEGLRVQGWEGARRVDRRSVRHARALVALADAIEERERHR